ncbi:hypothetical protein BHU16_03155 [Tannerella sp. oral taxon 808]|nr:hypothetical protein BHU16_03155 [Tannerella sp. oral taxon 808]
MNMKTALHIDLTFDQVLDMVKQLPLQQKIRLSKELEKETIDSMLTRLLESFRTDELDQNTIDEEVERVRQKLYERQNG